MKEIVSYITEKLKINKDSKVRKNPYPAIGDKCLVMYEYSENKYSLCIGNVITIFDNKEGFTLNIKDLNVEYYFYFIENTDKVNWNGRTARPGYISYDKDFALKELDIAIQNKSDKFDNKKISEDSITSFFESIKKSLDK